VVGSMQSRITFFNVSLANGHLMSRPVYEPEQSLVGEIMHAIENTSPYAAWVQIIFVRKDHSRHFMSLKHNITDMVNEIESPRVSMFTGQELKGDRPAKSRDVYTGASKRMKILDESLSRAHVLMAIQGMWIAKDNDIGRHQAQSLEEILPFSHCHDEADRLAVYTIRDPRMLIELVERNMVIDISRYFRSYTGARVEPPSFIISADELPYYIHIPYGTQANAIRAINWPEASTAQRGSMGDVTTKKKSSASLVFKTYGLPKRKEALDDAAKARLAHLASATERSFEIIYKSRRFSVLLHSKTRSDLLQYRAAFEAIYGTLDFEEEELKPLFLNELPMMVLQVSQSSEQPAVVEATSGTPQQGAVEEKPPTQTPDAAPPAEQPTVPEQPAMPEEDTRLAWIEALETSLSDKPPAVTTAAPKAAEEKPD